MLTFLVEFRPYLAILPVAEMTTIAESRTFVPLIPWFVTSASVAIVVLASCLVHPNAFRLRLTSLWVNKFVVFRMSWDAGEVR